jgi:hypothetical protein
MSYVVSVEDVGDLTSYLSFLTLLVQNSTGANSKDVVLNAVLGEGDIYFIEIQVYVDSEEAGDVVEAAMNDNVELQVFVSNDEAPPAPDDQDEKNNDLLLFIAGITGGIVLILGGGALFVYHQRGRRKRVFNPETKQEYVMPV